MGAAAQTLDTPRQLDPLINVELKVIEGQFKPAHIVRIQGKEFNVPDGCAVRIALPFGTKAVGFESQGEPTIDRDHQKCQQAFKLGLPSRYANTSSGQSVQPQTGGSYHVQVDWYNQWIDPLYIPVSWASVGLVVQWFDGGLFCNTNNAGYFYEGARFATGWYSLGQTDVGYVDACSVSGYTGSVVHANSIFPGCSPIDPMFLFWAPTSVYVDSNGTAYGEAYTFTTGGLCRLLLRVYPTNGVLTRYDYL